MTTVPPEDEARDEAQADRTVEQDRVSAQPAKMGSPLSERERECLIWTSGGKTSVEIARILGLSEHTVNHYLNNAARKLNAGNRTQAVAFAMRQGFID